jgi:hypothetical protein
MKPPPSRLHPSQALLPALACVAIALVVFWPVLPVFQAQFAPDSMPYFGPHHGLRQIEDVLFRGDSIPPSILYWLALPPLVAHELTYLVDTLLMVAAGALYLLGRRVRPAVAWLGGAALGFSGYSFTLVSAGHRGYFHMMACTLFAFPLLERIFRKEGRRWPRFALLGFALGWGILTQPDVFTLVAALAVFYLLWLTFRRSAVEGCETEPVFHRIRRVWPGFAIALAAFLLAGGGIFHALATRFIPDRLAQMRGGTPAHAVEQAPAVSSGEAAERKREDWIFATNWSLPPEDMLEFVAPCVRGIETSSEVCPYWGRLGRSDGWETSRQGFRNFRQHTLYLGAIQVLFALLAVGAWFRHRKDEPLPPWLRDVPFWAVAGLVALLLSFGRYAPFYRVFYAIPGMSLLRAPVKLLHLTEICVAMLFACGLAEVLQRKAEKPLPLTAPVLLALPGIALVAASALVRGGPATLLESWKALGYPPDYARVFLPQMAGALLHGGLLWLAGVAIWLVGRKGGKSATLALLLAWLCVGGDLIAVSRLYIRPFDVSRLYRDHPLFDTILEDDSIPCPFVANLVSTTPLTSTTRSAGPFRSTASRRRAGATTPATPCSASARTPSASGMCRAPTTSSRPKASSSNSPSPPSGPSRGSTSEDGRGPDRTPAPSSSGARTPSPSPPGTPRGETFRATSSSTPSPAPPGIHMPNRSWTRPDPNPPRAPSRTPPSTCSPCAWAARPRWTTSSARNPPPPASSRSATTTTSRAKPCSTARLRRFAAATPSGAPWKSPQATMRSSCAGNAVESSPSS